MNTDKKWVIKVFNKKTNAFQKEVSVDSYQQAIEAAEWADRMLNVRTEIHSPDGDVEDV